MSEDLSQTKVVKRVMAEAKEVMDFVKIDRIDSICIDSNQISVPGDFTCTAVNMCNTRMNVCYDYVVAAQNQHDFGTLLWGSNSFQVYYKERSTKVQDSTCAILD